MSENTEMKNDKPSFLLGFFIGVSIISLVSFFILFGLMWKLNGTEEVVADDASNPTVAVDGPAVDDQGFPVPETKIAPEVQASEHIWGNPDAKVTIIEYSDFECPFCGRHYPTMKQIKDTYGDSVRIIFRHFPLDFHAHAVPAAKALECAGDQNKFWEMYEKLFVEANVNARFGEENLYLTFAKELGLNEATFSACTAGTTKDGKIKDDMDAGAAAGVTGTPGTFINDKYVSGAYPFEYFQSIIDAELAK